MHAPKNRKGLLSRCYSFLPPPVILACKCRCRTTVHREASFSTRKHKRYPQPIIWIVAISMICSARLLSTKYRVFLQGQRLIPIYIRHPKLALLLTGTPGQIDGLLSSYENGLPSRTLIYTFREAPHWKEMGDDCISLEDSFKPIAHRVSELYNFCLAHPVLFHFNRLQWNRLNEIFSRYAVRGGIGRQR